MGFILRGKYCFTDFSADDGGMLKDSAVYIEGNKIIAVGDPVKLSEQHPEAEIIGNDHSAVMPGIIDAHSHGSGLSHVQRAIGFDFLENSLYDWSGCVVLPPELNAPLTALRHLSNGATFMHHNVMGVVGDKTALDISRRYLDAYRKTGMRAALSPGIRDVNALISDDEAFYETLPEDLKAFTHDQIFFNKEDARKAYFDWFEALFESHNSDMTRVFLGPCWAHGSTDELLLQTKEAAEAHGHLPIHIHTLQTPIQRGYGMKKYGMSLLQRMYKLGIVDDNLTLGHAVYLDEKDIQILADTGASITHHASCNLAMRNGISPVWFLQKAGVNVALGLDEKSINDDEDVFMEMRVIYYLSRLSGFDLANTPALNGAEVFRMGTVNAAKSVGMQGLIGAIRPGMLADVIVMDLDEVENKPCVAPGADPLKTLIHRAMGRFVTDVFVDGRRVIADGKCTTIDTEALYREVRDFVSKGLPEEKRRYAEKMAQLKPYMQAWCTPMQDWTRDPYYLVNSRS